jgi:hypothetical protein
MKRILSAIVLLGLACGKQHKEPRFGSDHISDVITRMTDVMIHDITNPPLAARFFAYACMAGNEVMAPQTLHKKINGYPLIKKPDSITNYHTQLTALLAMLLTAQKMQPSGSLLRPYQQHFLDSLENTGLSRTTIDNSLKYAAVISKAILAYAKADNYNKISNYPRYTPINQEGYWYPTPPAYLPAVEPYFSTVRTFALDSCNQFVPPAPIPFSRNKNSPFHALVTQNYTASQQLTDEQKAIAAFWDCNPFAVKSDGHLILSQKKISPGAHWMGITGIACAKADKKFGPSMTIFTTVAMGLTDAFICCWREKFQSNRIRPETAIRNAIDPQWQPLLQTPPFPEYLSGHSVISAASATILTHYFGKSFQYTDSVEVSYGLPPRHFASFQQAAQEAAISRFYGGIHFMDAIDNGLVVGRRVGEQMISKITAP